MNLKNLKRIDMTCKDYSGQDATCPVENYPEIRNWIMALQPQVRHFLYRDNRKPFLDLWGKPSFYYTSEFRFHCYPFDLENAKLLILTAKGKGTCYELICLQDGVKIRKDKDVVTSFLEELIGEMK